MRPLTFATALAAGMIAMPNPGSAQAAGGTAVTFTVSLNLTQLPPDLDRVRLVCAIKPSAVLVYPSIFGGMNPSSETYPYKSDMWVAAGQVVGAMSVVYPIPAEWLKDPIGKTADYECMLLGFSTSLKQWGFLSDSPSAPVFLLKPTPGPIHGTFVW